MNNFHKFISGLFIVLPGFAFPQALGTRGPLEDSRDQASGILFQTEHNGWATDSLVAYREGEHLLFLTRNPDNETYGLRGSMFDMKKAGGSYVFMADRIEVSAFGSGNSENFLNQVREIINQQD